MKPNDYPQWKRVVWYVFGATLVLAIVVGVVVMGWPLILHYWDVIEAYWK